MQIQVINNSFGFFAAVSRGTNTDEFAVILNERKLIVDLLHKKREKKMD